jgi:hypothetical protein
VVVGEGRVGERTFTKRLLALKSQMAFNEKNKLKEMLKPLQKPARYTVLIEGPPHPKLVKSAQKSPTDLKHTKTLTCFDSDKKSEVDSNAVAV